MKTKILFFALTFCVCFLCRAQQIHYGLTLNANFTKMDAKGLSSKAQTGYNGGAFATIDLGKKISLQPQVIYTLKNLDKADNFSTYYVYAGRTFANTNINLHYISIPVYFNYHISNFFTVNAGPEYSVMVFNNDNLLKAGGSAFKKSEAGVNAGVQFKFSPAFNVFASYYYGLTNINNIDDRYKWHSNQIRVGINCRVF